MSIESFIGSKISITTHNELRYEGLLFNLNTKDSSLVLQNVRCMDNEWNGMNEVAPSNTVHDFIVFKAEDIKDLSVEEVQKEEKPAMESYEYPGMSTRYASSSMDNLSSRPSIRPSQAGSVRSGYGIQSQPPVSVMPSNPFAAKGNAQIPVSPYSHDAQSFFRGAPTPPVNLPPVHLMPTHPVKPKQSDGMYKMFMDQGRPSTMQPNAGNDRYNLGEFDFGPDPFAESQSFGQENDNPTASFYDNKDYGFDEEQRMPVAMSTLPEMMSGLGISGKQKMLHPTNVPTNTPVKQRHDVSQPVMGLSPALASSAPAAADISQNSTDTKQRRPEPPKEADFLPRPQEKQKKTVEHSQTHQEPQAAKSKAADRRVLQPFYDKKNSFFDNLSQEAQTTRVSQREERQKQRELDMDTFGEESVRRNNYSRGGRGGRGGRRGRGDRRRFYGRGGRGNNNNNKNGSSNSNANISTGSDNNTVNSNGNANNANNSNNKQANKQQQEQPRRERPNRRREKKEAPPKANDTAAA